MEMVHIYRVILGIDDELRVKELTSRLILSKLIRLVFKKTLEMLKKGSMFFIIEKSELKFRKKVK